MASQQFATFRLGGHYFGIEVRDVQEVMKAQRMTKVPLASTDVAGLINLRGQIVTALDLGNRLDLEVGPDHDEALNVVVRTDDGSVSILVDEIGDVVDADDPHFERAPDTLTNRPRTTTTGAYQLTSPRTPHLTNHTTLPTPP